MVKLGLVTVDETPRPSARPRTKVVLPVPTSPISSMRILEEVCQLRVLAKVLPKFSISCSELIFII